MREKIYTIGHGNKGFAELLDILKEYNIQTLVDIRSYPGSKRNPHFNREAFEAELPQFSIAYDWFKGLGGYRKKGLGAKSPHVALKSEGFRNYADHMLTRGFKEHIDALLELAHNLNTCLMCAETLPFRCHRWLLSDYLAANQIEVIHIVGIDKTTTHKLSKYARIFQGNVFYDRVETEQNELD
ncbi:MAG: DUF488 domain-containing protein [Desulfobacterales bacterium]|nr:DUF488 domain-containing protein [Desulfobacterales bacterium]